MFTGTPQGFALLVTLLVLVVLASLTAGLATRLTMARRRQQYMIEYQRARYGLDSGIKYILSEIPKTTFSLQSREGDPDFSDLFWMNDEEYALMISDWAATATDEQIDSLMKEDAVIEQSEALDLESLLSSLSSLFGGEGTGAGEPNEIYISEDEEAYVIEVDPNDIQVPGPYGPPWPYVIEPIEMDIGPCHVTITIEDENAKMPLGWLVTKYSESNKQVQYSLETFGEWMRMSPEEIKELQAECEEISEKKLFKLNAGAILVKKTTTTSRQSASTRRTTTTSKTQTATQERPAVGHTTDYAKLFHSSLLDREMLALPIPDTGERVETALKYLGLWGSQRVNINTAPRHVLQAAFMLALAWDDAVNVANEVIVQRQQEAFKSTDSLKEIGLLDTTTYNNLKNYVSTTSTFFKVTVTSSTGSACAKAVLTVVKEGNQTETLMVLYDESQ